MLLRQNPRLKRKARRVWSQRQEVFVLIHNARSVINFLPDDVAENAALFVQEILLCALQFFDHVDRNNGQRDQLRMGVLERFTRSFTVVLENEDVLEPLVLLQVENTITECPKHVFNSLGREGSQTGNVLGGLDNNFMRPD